MTEITNDIKKAAKAIQKGYAVAFPTDTIFGLGTDAYNDEAVLNIFKIKKRDLSKPLIINISDINMIKDIVIMNNDIRKFVSEFWPGKVTFVFKMKKKIFKTITNGGSTIAVRMPDSKDTLRLIKEVKCPIVSTSANIEGQPEPRFSKDIDPRLVKKIDVILIETEDKPSGKASTIVDVSNKIPKIIRIGEESTIRKLHEYMIKFNYRHKYKGNKNGKNQKRN